MLDLRPERFQADGAVRNASIAGPFPEFAVGDVEIVIQQIGLERLKRACDDLPAVFGLEKEIQGGVPADPEEILLSSSATLSIPCGCAGG